MCLYYFEIKICSSFLFFFFVYSSFSFYPTIFVVFSFPFGKRPYRERRVTNGLDFRGQFVVVRNYVSRHPKRRKIFFVKKKKKKENKPPHFRYSFDRDGNSKMSGIGRSRETRKRKKKQRGNLPHNDNGVGARRR